MQPFAQTSTAGTAYTAAQVQAQFAANAGERWRFDRLDANGGEVSDITSFVQFDKNPPKITHDASSAVKRTIDLVVRGDLQLNWLRDLIRPRYGLLMPDGGYVEWSLGVFTMALPEKQITPMRTYQTIKGYDLTQVLAGERFQRSFSLPRGTTGVQAVALILAQGDYPQSLSAQIPDAGRVLPNSLTFRSGDTLLSAINIVLDAMTFQPIFSDELGILRSVPFPDYNTVLPSFVFDTTKGASLVKSPITTMVDLSKAINQCLVLVEDARSGVGGFSAYYENNRPDSPVSIQNWHKKLLVIKDSKITDPVSAQARAVLEVQRGAFVYAQLPVRTIPWPLSQDLDVYGIVYSTTDEGLVSANYLELGWTHMCETGAATTHKLLKLVAA